MTDPADSAAPPDDGGDVDPAEAFSTLGHPLRLAVVSTLHEHTSEAPLSFSTLYDRVGSEGTGRFNYHLGKLVPHFVSKGDAGYDLTAAGERLARAVTAGTYTHAPEVDTFALDGACYHCGASSLVAAYEDEHFRVECRDCGRVVLRVSVPPSLVRGRDPAAFADAFDRWSRAQVRQAREGLCPDCGGAVERSAVPNTHDVVAVDLLARFDCTVCGRSVVTSFGALAAAHPAVSAFYRRRGVSFDERHYWEVPQFVTDDHAEVVSRDPVLVRVSFPCDGDACRVDVDGDLRAVRTEVVSESHRR